MKGKEPSNGLLNRTGQILEQYVGYRDFLFLSPLDRLVDDMIFEFSRSHSCLTLTSYRLLC